VETKTMSEPNLIKCPKCKSTQVTAGKKGFSGKQAVAGAILTGGIGILAGTIGSNKVRITCLNCGHEFKPGEGFVETNNPTPAKSDFDEIQERQRRLDAEKQLSPEGFSDLDRALVKILKEGSVNGAKSHYSKVTGCSAVEADQYVESLIRAHNLTDKVSREACFIATACYEDYDAPEVLVFRRFRDQVLSQSALGRHLISVYYFLSPPVAEVVMKSNYLKRSIRQFILNPLARFLS
jgi:rubredoxin